MIPVGPVIARARVAAERDEVWRLLTSAEERAAWLPELSLGEGLGGSVSLDADGATLEGVIDVWVAGHVVGWKWNRTAENRPTAPLITLRSSEAGTAVTVTETGFDALGSGADLARAAQTAWGAVLDALLTRAGAAAQEDAPDVLAELASAAPAADADADAAADADADVADATADVAESADADADATADVAEAFDAADATEFADADATADATDFADADATADATDFSEVTADVAESGGGDATADATEPIDDPESVDDPGSADDRESADATDASEFADASDAAAPAPAAAPLTAEEAAEVVAESAATSVEPGADSEYDFDSPDGCIEGETDAELEPLFEPEVHTSTGAIPLPDGPDAGDDGEVLDGIDDSVDRTPDADPEPVPEPEPEAEPEADPEPEAADPEPEPEPEPEPGPGSERDPDSDAAATPDATSDAAATPDATFDAADPHRDALVLPEPPRDWQEQRDPSILTGSIGKIDVGDGPDAGERGETDFEQLLRDATITDDAEGFDDDARSREAGGAGAATTAAESGTGDDTAAGEGAGSDRAGASAQRPRAERKRPWWRRR